MAVGRLLAGAGALAAGVAVLVGHRDRAGRAQRRVVGVVVLVVVGCHRARNPSSAAAPGAAPQPRCGGHGGGGGPRRKLAARSAQQLGRRRQKSAAIASSAAAHRRCRLRRAAPTLQPPTTGRKVVQSAQLQLAAAPNRIDDVAQEVYDVIGSLNGIVESSTVTETGGSDGSANFQLSVPSGSLGQAMSRLSSLSYASVLSRTDATQDITDQYGAAKRALADARALRTSLLKQLASATTTEQIDSLKAQIRDAEASISSDQATLNRLNRPGRLQPARGPDQRPVQRRRPSRTTAAVASASARPRTMPAAC